MSETTEPNETNDQQSQPPQTPKKEKVGDIIHKERVTRRITLETIAKDLKLNVKYIKAIESNIFTDLPADPYVRVYLRSIANYLMLEPDDILKRFFEDRGIPSSDIESEKTDKIKINLEKDKEKNSKPLIIIITIIAILGILTYVSSKKGWIPNTPSKDSVPAVDTTTESKSSETDSFETYDTLKEDSINNLDELSDTSEESESSEKTDNPLTAEDSLKLVINATYDSVWVQIFYDGRSWKNFVKSGRARSFRAKDSIHLHVGNNKRLRYTLNDKKITLPGGGVKVFRIDHDGIEVWKMSQWKTTFKDRLQQ